jgi:hypothetical protein
MGVHSQPREKISKTPISINNPGMAVLVYACNVRFVGGIGRRIMS